MRIALFYHSLISDWNHGNAHFLRGIAAELLSRGHQVRIFEPADGWSRQNLLADGGPQALEAFASRFPELTSESYDLSRPDYEEWLAGASLVLVHEWNDPALVRAIGQWRSRNANARVWFHDTHHRAVTSPEELARFDLSHYDGVLAYGASLKAAYERSGWGKKVHIWHEAADARVFYPRPAETPKGDLVWVGNWGDDERTAELHEFLLQPAAQLRLRAKVFGVRYPEAAKRALQEAGVAYGGWLPNYEVPNVFGDYCATVHVPRRPYVRQLPGIPTIRPFEALACGIPLVSSPWNDSESLFRVGTDFLMAQDGEQMKRCLRDVLHDTDLAKSLARHGLETIRNRHTCAHRVDELLRWQEIALQ